MRDDYSKQTIGGTEPFPVLHQGPTAEKDRGHTRRMVEWKKAGQPPILEKAG